MKKPLYTVKTLSEVGNTLPIDRHGTDRDGKFSFKGGDNTFSFKEWDLKTTEPAIDKALKKITKEKKGDAEFVKEVLKITLDRCCGVDFNTADEHKKENLLNQMETGNNFYMYIYLRYEEFAEELSFPDITCGVCGHEHKKISGNLEKLDIHCKTKDENAFSATHKLRKSITLNGKKCTHVKYGCSQWSSLYTDSGSMEGLSDLKKSTLLGALKGAGYKGEDGKFVWVDSVPELIYNAMKKADVELLVKEIPEIDGGPKIELKLDCHGKDCDHVITSIFDPSYLNFFGGSSL